MHSTHKLYRLVPYGANDGEWVKTWRKQLGMRLTPKLPRPIGSGAVDGPLHGVKKVVGSQAVEQVVREQMVTQM